ncbi:hypothetical protein SAMN02787142_0668 [Burkholderia sp. WP9]|nr:hypothetical protein SAMN02787142_0668 [Burkholderia sp. WP9]
MGQHQTGFRRAVKVFNRAGSGIARSFENQPCRFPARCRILYIYTVLCANQWNPQLGLPNTSIRRCGERPSLLAGVDVPWIRGTRRSRKSFRAVVGRWERWSTCWSSRPAWVKCGSFVPRLARWANGLSPWCSHRMFQTGSDSSTSACPLTSCCRFARRRRRMPCGRRSRFFAREAAARCCSGRSTSRHRRCEDCISRRSLRKRCFLWSVRWPPRRTRRLRSFVWRSGQSGTA